MKLSRVTLSNYYKAMKIRYSRPEWVKPMKFSQEKLQRLRQNFVINLTKHLMDGREVICMDETSTCLWERKRKVWQPRGIPIKQVLSKTRGQSITILGAISTHRPEIMYTLDSKTNNASVLNFF